MVISFLSSSRATAKAAKETKVRNRMFAVAQAAGMLQVQDKRTLPSVGNKNNDRLLTSLMLTGHPVEGSRVPFCSG
jgi:hypothetical protein